MGDFHFKIKDILKVVKVGAGVGSALAPGAVGKVLSEVTKSIDDPNDRNNAEGLKTVAQVDDEQNEAILALHKRLIDQNERIKKLEALLVK